MPINPIPCQRIKELAAKFVFLDTYRVLSAIVEEQTTSTPQQIVSTPHAVLASAFTMALASVIGVKQRPHTVADMKIPTRAKSATTSGSVSKEETKPEFLKPTVPVARLQIRQRVQGLPKPVPIDTADEGEKAGATTSSKCFAETPTQTSLTAKRKGQRAQQKKNVAALKHRSAGVRQKQMRPPKPKVPEFKGAVPDEEQIDEEDVTQPVENRASIVAIGKRSAAVAAVVVTHKQLNPTQEQPKAELVEGAGNRK